MNRKTIKDVIAEYPDGLPENEDKYTHIFSWSDGTISMCTTTSDVYLGNCKDAYLICSREEYDAEIERIAEENRLFFTGQRIMRDMGHDIDPREFFKDCVDESEVIKEKTVEDVYEMYKEWPSFIATICTEHKGEFHFQSHDSFNSFRVVCTYWEYKEYKDKQEKIMNEDVIGWYDYDKQEAIDGKHPIKDEVIQACIVTEDGFKNVSYATTVNNGSFDIHLCYVLGEGSWFTDDIRPLDWDKNIEFNKFKIQFVASCNKDSDIYHGTGTSQLNTIAKLAYDAGARFK